jgi:hypothetical protein
MGVLSKWSLNFYEILNFEFLMTYGSQDPETLFGITGPDPGGKLTKNSPHTDTDPEYCIKVCFNVK